MLEDVIPTAQYVIKHPTSNDCLSDSGGNSEERNTRLLSNSMKWQTSRPWDAFYGHCIDFKPAHKKKKKKKKEDWFLRVSGKIENRHPLDTLERARAQQ